MHCYMGSSFFSIISTKGKDPATQFDNPKPPAPSFYSHTQSSTNYFWGGSTCLRLNSAASCAERSYKSVPSLSLSLLPPLPSPPLLLLSPPLPSPPLLQPSVLVCFPLLGSHTMGECLRLRPGCSCVGLRGVECMCLHVI